LYFHNWGRRGRAHIYGSSNPVHGDVYSIQHYMIKFVSDLQQVGGFLRVLRLDSSTNKIDRHDNLNIVESDVKHHKPPTAIY